MNRLLVFVVVVLSGCSTTSDPAPQFVPEHGQYYMTGDPRCVTRAASKEQAFIACYDNKGTMTEKRRPLTETELAFYMSSQSSRNYQAPIAGPSPVISYPTMQTPAVAAIDPLGGRRINCISTGVHTSCR